MVLVKINIYNEKSIILDDSLLFYRDDGKKYELKTFAERKYVTIERLFVVFNKATVHC